MTHSEAQKIAKKMFGKYGYAVEHITYCDGVEPPAHERFGIEDCKVGNDYRGGTWEEALRKAGYKTQLNLL